MKEILILTQPFSFSKNTDSMLNGKLLPITLQLGSKITSPAIEAKTISCLLPADATCSDLMLCLLKMVATGRQLMNVNLKCLNFK